LLELANIPQPDYAESEHELKTRLEQAQEKLTELTHEQNKAESALADANRILREQELEQAKLATELNNAELTRKRAQQDKDTALQEFHVAVQERKQQYNKKLSVLKAEIQKLDAQKQQAIEELQEAAKKIGATNLDDVRKFLGGKEFALNTQANLMAAGSEASRIGRFAGSKPVRTALRFVPGLSVGFAALDAADVVAGPDSLANKGMDAAAMGIGATIGGVLGGGVLSPVGAAVGASTGKMVSDATQWLFGDKKSAEQRKMEEALQMLRGGY